MPRSLRFTFLASLATAAGVAAQPTKTNLTSAPPSCCAITSIDFRSAIVTAQEASTGHVFRFEMKDRAVLEKLKVGQKVWADFAAGKVRLDPAKPVSVAILSDGAAAPNLPEPAGAVPCCGITGINFTTRLVTAKINATGRTFQFEVTNQALLGSLKIGDKVWASGAARKAGLMPSQPCCNIVGPLPAGMP
ncbi:MAG: hypothetical protein ACRENB_06960 [Gemmatimonadales bacterium]